MALYKRGEIWWYDFTYKGERYRGSTEFKVKAKAERRLEQVRDSLKLGTAPTRQQSTIGEAADQWFASRVVGKKTATTVALRLKTLFRHLDRDMLVADIGPREIEAAILSRRVEPIRQSPKNGEPRFPTNGTVNRDLIDTTLRPILSYAEEIMEEPVKRIKWTKLRLKEPKGRMRVFTPEEMAAWRDALPPWHQPVFDFLARYGPRLSEAFFPPSDVHVNAGEIVFQDTKNGTDHIIPLLDEDVAPMAARVAKAKLADLDTVWFKEEEDGSLTPIHWRGFQSASRAALDAAGIMDAKPAHDLRHHAATGLLRATGNMKLVQELLNHQSYVSTARYAHSNKADLKAGLEQAYGTNATTKRSQQGENPVESKGGRVT